jgi:hypothetical protein
MATIDERLSNIATQVETLTLMQVETENRLQRLEENGQRLDKRIDRLFTITLRIGADFAERIKALEDEDAKGK